MSNTTLKSSDALRPSMDTTRAKQRAAIVHKYTDSRPSRLLITGYRFRLLRPIIRRIIERFEGGSMFSQSLRAILRERYDVDVGLYSYGPCLKPGYLPPGTRIGRYCSLAANIRIFRRNHPKDFLSLHPIFFNRRIGFVDHDTIPSIADNPLRIGHDVWMGYGATILPGCRSIGNGAIVAASAVVTKDVPDFAIVGGNPAKTLGHRFSPELAAIVTREEWWSRSIADLADSFSTFTEPATPAILRVLGTGGHRYSTPSDSDEANFQSTPGS